MNVKQMALIAWGGIALWCIFGSPDLSWLKLHNLTPNSPTAPTVAPPSAELQSKVAPVTAVLKGHGDKAKLLQGFFADFAVVVEKNPSVCGSTGQLQAHYSRAATMYFPFLVGPDKIDGLADALDKAFADILGLDNTALDPVKAKEALLAISWACGEAS